MSEEIAPVEAAPDRREALAAALDAVEVQATETSTPPAEPVRDEAGRFAAATPAIPAVEVPPPEEPLWKRPPNSWKKDYHDVWATAAGNPETAKLVEYAYQREEEMKRGIEAVIPKAKFADQVNEAMEPFRANIQASGVEPVKALQSLMVADHQLRHLPADQKKAYALNLLAGYGIQLTPEDAYTLPQAVDPAVLALRNDLNTERGHRLAFEQQQKDAETQGLVGEVEVFKQDKPDFDQYAPVMQVLLERELAPDLASAYEKAKRLDDTAFGETQKALQAKAIADQREAADKAAKQAKAAAVSVRSSTPGAPTPTKAQDRRSMIAEQLDGLNERF